MKKITVVGSLNMDTVIDVDHMPVVGETLLAGDSTLIPGGKGANQAFTIGKLGGDVTILGAVGADSYGEILCESLSSVGVHTEHLKHVEGVSTGNAIITVNKEGNNSIIVMQGANKCVDLDYIDQKMDVIEQSDIVIFQLEIPIETVLYTAQKAKALGKIVILDPAPAQANLPIELLQCVDIIKPNETELGILLQDPLAHQNLAHSTDRLLEAGIEHVLVTLGGDGAYLKSANQTDRRFYTQDVPVVDTTAAGDSFTAAVALGLANGQDLESAIEFADKVATIAVTRKGAQSSIPSMEETQNYIASLQATSV